MARRKGIAVALGSAALFGASTPLAKVLLRDTDPWVLAGLLYLGSGVGLALVGGLRRTRQAQLAPGEWRWLAAAVALGGVVAPVLLMIGLQGTAASTASLLLSVEGALTALIAWFIFREGFDRRVALGMGAIAGGAAILAWSGGATVASPWPPLLVLAACLCWALDNNLTRRVSLSDPLAIARLKGLVAGPTNLCLALLVGASLPVPTLAALAGVVGFFGYGVSLALFVVALRELGAARSGAYFSLAPFVGAAVGVGLLGEPLTGRLAAAGILMAIGAWLHVTERHEHAHEHEALEHDHFHEHDEHHPHAHDPMPAGGHAHTHRHEPLRHAHPHYPDAHHRHEH